MLRHTRVALSLCLGLFTSTGWANPKPFDTAPKDEVVAAYAVPIAHQSEIRALAERFDFEGRDNGDPVAYVPASQQQIFFAHFPDARVIQPDITKATYVDASGVRIQTTQVYNFAMVQRDLTQLATQNPTLAMIETYGQSSRGNSLLALHLGKGTGRPLMITGATHGNEVLTVDVVMEVVKRWLQKYGTDTRVTTLLDTHSIYFVPVVSPDSYIAQQRQVDGVDPNRDYPWPGDERHQSIAVIKAIMDFAVAKNIQGSVDIHSTAGVIMYPWAYTEQAISGAMFPVIRDLTERMAEANGYQTGQISDVMYVAKGSSADYYLWKINTVALAIELSQGFAKDSLHLSSITDEIEEPLARFVEHF